MPKKSKADHVVLKDNGCECMRCGARLELGALVDEERKANGRGMPLEKWGLLIKDFGKLHAICPEKKP